MIEYPDSGKMAAHGGEWGSAAAPSRTCSRPSIAARLFRRRARLSRPTSFATHRSTTSTSRSARGWSRSPAGRCRCSTRVRSPSTSRSARPPASSTSRTWGRSRRRPGCGRAARAPLTNDVGALADRRRRYGVLCREDGGDPRRRDHLPRRRRALPDGHNAANHERDLAWFADHAGDAANVDRPRRRLRDDRRTGPARPRDRAGDRERAAAGADDDRDANAERRRGARRGDRLHRRGRRRDAARPAGRPGRLEAILRRGAMPAGLAARDTLRTEVCYPLYGNELSTERGPIEAGLGWCCRSRGRLRRRRRRSPPPAASARAERLVPFVLDRGVARAGDPVVGGGTVTSGTYSPSLEVGIGMAYLPVERAQAGARSTSTSAAACATARSGRRRSTVVR